MTFRGPGREQEEEERERHMALLATMVLVGAEENKNIVALVCQSRRSIFFAVTRSQILVEGHRDKFFLQASRVKLSPVRPNDRFRHTWNTIPTSQSDVEPTSNP